ncbi:winged helix-turn-helix transcriptional regulator [Chitinophaga nivalis]|uniref:Helix-turn-helix transcriptional regulator n=1 Tax=Chitinophaga nivalis TaxID=2991709 RepID=A0ABT3IJI1_9BACT|nr:helix-turn-helix domain-containing protein [Chitinophaga nivalis]MCW3466188.1 helix-turn-helix transcriptional regulator [Chitinophaga nivalis]MCW3484121.1 helix-turn-helix transcriptional regulator [Chitinophaga nivalis]
MTLITRCERTAGKEVSLALRDAIELLGGKWKICILQNLSYFGTMRFKDLQQEIAGISPKVLTEELRQMEQNFLITKTVNNTKPVTVSYSLTAYADETRDVFTALLTFGTKHRKKVMNNSRRTG